MIIYNKYYRGMVIKVVIIGYSKSLKEGKMQNKKMKNLKKSAGVIKANSEYRQSLHRNGRLLK